MMQLQLFTDPAPPVPVRRERKRRERSASGKAVTARTPSAERFGAMLRASGLPHVAVDEAKRAVFRDAKLRAFDFIVYAETGPNWLVYVGPRRKPRMDDDQRARLLADTRPMPADANVSTLRVALAAPSARPSERSKRPAAAGAPPTLVIHDPGDDDDTPPKTAATLLDNTLHVSGPTHGIVSLNGIGIAAVGGSDASSFAPLRALTLQGLHVGVVLGEGSDELALRTRASENRIFIVNAAAGRLVVFNPGGERIEPTASEAVLSVCQAADKQVAWQTDVICGRRPAAYEF